MQAPIAVTAGEPAGIGPEITVRLAADHPACVVIADRRLMNLTAETLGVQLRFVDPEDSDGSARIACHHVPTAVDVRSGRLDTRNSAYVINTLVRAVEGCSSGEFSAMVTAPVHKGVINDAGIPFTGHTEFLAEHTATRQVVMMLVAGTLRVALVTTHLPLRRVPDAITHGGLKAVLTTLRADLTDKFGIEAPRIVVCGLNPHAGENGHLGREEIDVIEPVLRRLRGEGWRLEGPLPADTAFLPGVLERCDAVLAMYHDQGLPVLKHAGFGQAVNVTLGLPIIRTSVDHGTALDLAGSGKADPASLLAAFALAEHLVAACRS